MTPPGEVGDRGPGAEEPGDSAEVMSLLGWALFSVPVIARRVRGGNLWSTSSSPPLEQLSQEYSKEIPECLGGLPARLAEEDACIDSTVDHPSEVAESQQRSDPTSSDAEEPEFDEMRSMDVEVATEDGLRLDPEEPEMAAEDEGPFEDALGDSSASSEKAQEVSRSLMADSPEFGEVSGGTISYPSGVSPGGSSGVPRSGTVEALRSPTDEEVNSSTPIESSTPVISSTPVGSPMRRQGTEAPPTTTAAEISVADEGEGTWREMTSPDQTVP